MGKHKKNIVENITKEIKKLEDKKFRFYFYVIDTKGTPNGSTAYEYETAYILKEMGYDVRMLHADKEFIGVESWMGEKYAKIPHYNVESDGVTISPADFLVIPEFYSNVMYKTMNLPCKRIVLLQNFYYMTEVIPHGASWLDYGINECIVKTNAMADRIKKYLPNVKTHVVTPSIRDSFSCSAKAKQPVINIFAKNQSDSNEITKLFFWKYPNYKWVSFRDIRKISIDEVSEVMKDSFCSVWIDEKTDFGYNALQSMKANNLVIGKTLENAPDWAATDKDGVIWFEKNDDAVDLIASVVETFINNRIPSEVYNELAEVVKPYNDENMKESIKSVYVDYFVENRIKEFKEYLVIEESKNSKKD